MELYAITFTSNDEWEMSSGVMIISAKSRSKAKELFKNKCSDEIMEITLLKNNKQGVLFHQDVVIQ